MRLDEGIEASCKKELGIYLAYLACGIGEAECRYVQVRAFYSPSICRESQFFDFMEQSTASFTCAHL
jgi:hypothetical protein